MWRPREARSIQDRLQDKLSEMLALGRPWWEGLAEFLRDWQSVGLMKQTNDELLTPINLLEAIAHCGDATFINQLVDLVQEADHTGSLCFCGREATESHFAEMCKSPRLS